MTPLLVTTQRWEGGGGVMVSDDPVTPGHQILGYSDIRGGGGGGGGGGGNGGYSHHILQRMGQMKYNCMAD